MPPPFVIPARTNSEIQRRKLKSVRQVEFVRQTSGARLSVFALLFGRGTVIYRIWPAILVHTLFATAVVLISHKTRYSLGIQSLLLNVVSMVLGFVVSLRVSSAYDRYWMGRVHWGDVIRNIRTLSRISWFHILPRMTASKDNVTQEDVERVIEEKRTVLDLLEAFAFALKHHLREEPGPYYEDLYPLLMAIENSPYHQHREPNDSTFSPVADVSHLPNVPPAGTYGTFESSMEAGAGAPLLPSSAPKAPKKAMSLIPFYEWLSGAKAVANGVHNKTDPQLVQEEISTKHHPKLAGGGGNIPLEIIRCLAEWAGTIEDRGTCSGPAMGNMIGCITALEDCLTALERILTTPLPFVYSAHIRHTVWLYLFTMSFQLTDTFGYITIPGVAVASFLFLGFLAAGEELEQPFGNDRNDLDLDSLCRDIIHVELEDLRKSASPHSYLALPGAVDPGSIYGHGAVVDAGIRYRAGREESHDLVDSPRATSPNASGSA